MLKNEWLILEPTGTSGRTGRGGGEQLGGHRGCPPTQLHPIPGCFAETNRHQEEQRQSQKQWQELGSSLPAKSPAFTQAPSSSPPRRLPEQSKVVCAQERSCRTPWPWGGPRGLCHQRGSATAANPAEKARCTEITSCAFSAPLAPVQGERSKNPATTFPNHNRPWSQTASLASARKPDAKFWDYRQKEL